MTPRYPSSPRLPGLSGGIVVRSCASKSFVLRVRHFAMNSLPWSGAFGSVRRSAP